MKQKKYTAHVKNNVDGKEFTVEGYGPTAQEFHKIVMNEHIDYQKDEIMFVTNERNRRVFDINTGFFGS